jgi:hypothetical protein
MDSMADKLSRLSALRPRPGGGVFRPDATSPAGSEKLMQLLGAESRVNRLGSHILATCRFPHPLAGEMDYRAVRLIASGPVEELCDPGRWLFLDTETTGLAGGTGTYAFLVGLAWWERDSFVVEQYFMREHGEEPSMLHGLLERFSRRPVLVTFNGKSFDWPLLQTRFQMRRLGTVQEPSAHLDFLHPARLLWRRCLESVALAQLERHVLGLDRGQDIPSEGIPRRYFDFLRGGPPEEMAEVFRHNRLDLCGLASLALHMIRILADPENCAGQAEELLGVSRLLQRRGEERLAGQLYRKALDAGLPKDVEPFARRELALLAKRGRDFELSNALWEKLLSDSAEGLRAYEQLAIYYEHYARMPQRAAELSREALVSLQEALHAGRMPSRQYIQWHGSFQHRLNRLTAKLAGNR